MSGPKHMTESIVERVPFETVPEIKYDTKDLQEMTEEAKKKEGLPPGAIMVFEAKIFHAGRVTANGRLYRPQLLRAASARLNEDVKERRVKGLAGHPKPDESPDPSRACLVPLGLWMEEEDGSGWSKAAVPDTSKGRDLAALVRMGVKVGFSIRGRGKSRQVEMTDKHPCYQGNEHWAGKVIEDVEDHYRLEAYDWVDNQAVRDAELSNYHESEDAVEFKIEELTEEQWKTIINADKIKAHVAEATKEATKGITEEQVRKLAEGEELAKVLVGNKKLVEDLAKNKAFTEALAAQFDDGEPEPEPEKKVECTTCKKPITEGSTFCAVCGARQVAMTEGVEPDKPGDEKDKAIKALTEANQKLTERQEKIEAERKADKDKAAVEKIVTEAVQDKPEKVQSGVRNYLAEQALTPDNAGEKAKAAVEFIEGLLGDQATEGDTGKGHSQNADGQVAEDDKNKRNHSPEGGGDNDLLEAEALNDNMDRFDTL